MILRRRMWNCFGLRGLVRKSATLSCVGTCGTTSSNFSTMSRTKKHQAALDMLELVVVLGVVGRVARGLAVRRERSGVGLGVAQAFDEPGVKRETRKTCSPE